MEMNNLSFTIMFCLLMAFSISCSNTTRSHNDGLAKTDAIMTPPNINSRAQALQTRLAIHEIHQQFDFLPYFEFSEDKFATTKEAGSRLLIFLTNSYVALNPEDIPDTKLWLIEQGLWSGVSTKEKKLYEGEIEDERQIAEYSWQVEHAYILGWALGLVAQTPDATRPATEEELTAFLEKTPLIGEETESFLAGLEYRAFHEIYDENLFHELATTHFRDAMFMGFESKTDIDSNISFYRHISLNWLRRFMDIKDWDETDTST